MADRQSARQATLQQPPIHYHEINSFFFSLTDVHSCGFCFLFSLSTHYRGSADVFKTGSTSFSKRSTTDFFECRRSAVGFTQAVRI